MSRTSQKPSKDYIELLVVFEKVGKELGVI